ncbi:hypothetical protein [Azovibrio restrictus]|uniref:hypothetical protein n=1 Tax=Azovibrio restrictus TaxID=146938 RepID=UPI000413D201|nr:hypothetical protein [Azovibrio restrictus]
MTLVPCRACGHQVDTSALACPGCGATDPGRSISRQQRDLRILAVQIVLGLVIFVGVGSVVWKQVEPMVAQLTSKAAAGH